VPRTGHPEHGEIPLPEEKKTNDMAMGAGIGAAIGNLGVGIAFGRAPGAGVGVAMDSGNDEKP
jgi:F0F1-type ATP synthase membrane subunit c/vacuolar-type H+-ATPase subunit K